VIDSRKKIVDDFKMLRKKTKEKCRPQWTKAINEDDIIWMVSISAIEQVLLFFTVLGAHTAKGGYIQLIAWNLEPAHQVTPEFLFVTLLPMASRTQ
jgi:hypothetical protein